MQFENTKFVPRKNPLEATFLVFVFEAKRNYFVLKDDLAQCLEQHGSDCELIMKLAESLARSIKHRPFNRDIAAYFERCKTQGKDYLKEYYRDTKPICHPMQIFCEEIGLFLKDVYERFQSDDLLLVRRQLSLKGQLQCNLILCEKYPDSIEYALEYAQSVLYYDNYENGKAFIAKKIKYFQQTRQSKKSNILRPYLYALSILQQPQFPWWINQRQMHKQLVLSLFESYKLDCFSIMLKMYQKYNPQSKDLLALSFIERMLDFEPPSPKKYRDILADISKECCFYNLAMCFRFYKECRYDQCESYLKQELLRNQSQSRLYVHNQAALVYLKLGKYQLCLDNIFKSSIYMQNPKNASATMAFCYLMLNQKDKARPIVKSLDENKQNGVKLMVIYSKLRRIRRLNDLFMNLWDKQTDNISRLQILVIFLINGFQFDAGNRYSTIMNEIIQLSLTIQPNFLSCRKQFMIYYFMCQYCFDSKYPERFRNGRFFARKADEVIKNLKEYSEKGAAYLKSMIEEKKSIDIEHELYI